MWSQSLVFKDLQGSVYEAAREGWGRRVPSTAAFLTFAAVLAAETLLASRRFSHNMQELLALRNRSPACSFPLSISRIVLGTPADISLPKSCFRRRTVGKYLLSIYFLDCSTKGGPWV